MAGRLVEVGDAIIAAVSAQVTDEAVGTNGEEVALTTRLSAIRDADGVSIMVPTSMSCCGYASASLLACTPQQEP